MVASGEEKRVCVTGASGYIASFIVKLLLNRGYIVHATVRSSKDEKKINHLLSLDGAKERLHLFEATLMEEGSFDSAIHGCVGVFHTASPVQLEVKNPHEELIDPAVKGTLNVLASCAKNPSVKRVILTSSMATVLFSGKTLGPEVTVDETWYSAPEFCENSPMKWYLISKTLAEEAAWKFAKEKGIDMVSINPGVVIGPSLLPTTSASMGFIYHLLSGAEAYHNAAMAWVHVIDVAKAHVLAFETSSAKGRYLLTENVAHFSQVVEMLRELYPNTKLPNKCQTDEPFEPTFKVSQEKVRGLGIDYIPLKTSLKETVEWFKEKHILNI